MEYCFTESNTVFCGVYFFISGTFNDADIVSHCIMLNEMMISEFESMWRETIVIRLKTLFRYSLRRTE